MANTFSEISSELALRAADGDRGAIEAIVRALQRPIFNVALRMMMDRGDAEDATQEALIRIVTRLAQFRGDASFTTWAWRVAIRRILDVRDRRAGAPSLTFAALSDDLADGLDPAAPERPEDAIALRQIKRLCGRAMLQCLDLDHRIAFILGEILELTSTDAAEILEIDPATFRKRLSRGRRELTTFLTGQCGVASATAPCACHRRLGRATALGRVRREHADDGGPDVATVRAQLVTVGELRRAAEFYRCEPDQHHDFVTTVRTMLGQLPSAKELS